MHLSTQKYSNSNQCCQCDLSNIHIHTYAGYIILKCLSTIPQDGAVEVNSSVESYSGGNECTVNKSKVSSDD